MHIHCDTYESLGTWIGINIRGSTKREISRKKLLNSTVLLLDVIYIAFIIFIYITKDTFSYNKIDTGFKIHLKDFVMS